MIKNINRFLTPFFISPKGEKMKSPSTLGEGWEGGNLSDKEKI
jgi:hypothetical protein